MGRPGYEGQLKDLDSAKVEALARLASEYGSKAVEADDGVVHFYEHYDGSGDNANDYKVIFPTGFEHAPGGPQPDEVVNTATAGASGQHAAKRADEEDALLQAERQMQLDFVRKCLKEEEALERVSTSTQTEAKLPRGHGHSATASGQAPPSTATQVTDVANMKKLSATAETFGTGLFARGFLDTANKKLDGTQPPKPSKDVRSFKDSMPQVDPTGGPDVSLESPVSQKAKKRVSFSEEQRVFVYDDAECAEAGNPQPGETGASGAADSFETAMMSGGLPPEEGGLLEWVEGATKISDNILTEERMAYMEQLIAMNEELANSEEELANSDELANYDEADESDMTFPARTEDDNSSELECGYISGILGPDPRAAEQLAPAPSELPHGEQPPADQSPRKNGAPGVCVGASSCPAEEELPMILENRADFSDVPRCSEPGQKEGQAVESVVERDQGSVTTGDDCTAPLAAVDDRVVERAARRRRVPRRRKVDRLVPQPPVVTLPLERLTPDDGGAVLSRTPDDCNQEDLPVVPGPIVSKFKQMRLLEESQ